MKEFPPTLPGHQLSLNMSSSSSRLALLALLANSASAKMVEELAARMNQQAAPKVPFKACIDDSDCGSQGPGFACFQYICYPWADDSAIAKEDRKDTCKSDDDCPGQLSCFRHHDRRQIQRGLCMEPIADCAENGRDHCAQKKCCNGQFCCGSEYFSQLAELPCFSHRGCRALGYGNFCCPAKGNSTAPAQCCNEDPNPTTTTMARPKPQTSKVNDSPALTTGYWILDIFARLFFSR